MRNFRERYFISCYYYYSTAGGVVIIGNGRSIFTSLALHHEQGLGP